MYLMNGTGVGFSVERQYVNKLPMINEEFFDTDTVIIVSDSKLGWAKALKELIFLLAAGQIPKWNLSRVRPAGAPFKNFWWACIRTRTFRRFVSFLCEHI